MECRLGYWARVERGATLRVIITVREMLMEETVRVSCDECVYQTGKAIKRFHKGRVTVK